MICLISCVVVVAMISLTGCQPPRAAGGGFDSDDPASKLYAIRRAGAQRDAQSIEPLVVELGSDDPAVRMLAIDALERITGERLGYNPYAPQRERRQMAQRWAEAVSAGYFDSSVTSSQ